jgi:cellulose synthase/poly-beta-1,6-N-acetylglucosamine synthase-like glycosyltransferase/spore germination protein YaaH/peptidoglycan/xylan/chitin deacetylase (PgdA/CDA1 family)
MAEGKPIFYDQKRRRWRWTRRVLEISGALFTLLVMVFFVSVIRRPNLPELLLPDTRPALHAIRSKRPAKPPVLRTGRKRRVAALGKVPQNYDPLRAAFYVPWDANSLNSLQQHYRDIDVLIPEALHAVSPDGRLDVELDPKLSGWLKTSGIELPIMPLVNNYDGQNWRVPEMAGMLARPESRERLAQALANFATKQKDPGIVLDFEEVPDASQTHFKHFTRDLAAALHAAGLKLMVALPARDDAYDYAYIASQADAIILMNYDQHWPTSLPGPIASQDWFLENMQDAQKLVPPEKLVMGIANYTYDWPVPKRRSPNSPARVAQSFSFQEAIVHAVESEATVEFDDDSLNPHYSYEDNNQVHNVWLLDGVTAYNEIRAAERAGVRGTALWRLGDEDPSLWSIWDTTHPDNSIRARLEDCPPGYDITIEGEGDIWRISDTPKSGRRSFDYDSAADTFTDETYESYPLSWRIEQFGAAPHKIALTFDDGPDPRWTPGILSVLEEKHVPATFFVTGVNADSDPRLLKREYADGNDIGNHTYTHPSFDQVSRAQLQIELNLTQRLFESTLGIRTLLFRPPYGIDHQPESASEVAQLPLPQSMGYLIIGARIDPDDWGEPGGGPPAPSDVLVQRVLDQVAGKVPGARGGNIILMHDGGGDRSHTVAALPVVIDRLEAQGYQFVTVSDLLGQTRAQVMPPLAPEERLLARADAFIFDLFHYLRLTIAFIFVAGIALVSGRALIVGLLALAEKLRPAPADHPEYQPRVSVLIPAYNEEAVIADTVRAALASNYHELEIIIVDDGSVDRTSEQVRANFGDDPRVRLIREPNRGKSAALNHALAEATGEVAVTIDADTIVDPQSIRFLVRRFADVRVAAIAGNVKVGNRNRWLTRWQALEYITSQNLEKRAFDLLNCIPVVPGAVGAWRTDMVRSCGGFSGDTVAEDTDLTLTLRRRGWKIQYDEDAIGHTEVPDTAEALIRQRFRWTFGTLQAVWKHRDTFGKIRYGTLGLIAIPNVFLFQILLPLVSPVIDLLFLASIVLWGLAQFRFARMPQLWTSEDVVRSLIFFAAFMLIDLLTCVIAFTLEKHEDWSLLAPLLIQRFYYRQMMYVVLFRALMGAVQGRAVGWRGVEPEVPAAVGPA